MPFITFIYKIGSNPKIYYGKCMYEYISDDHEGLDTIINYELRQGINMYRKQNNLSKLKSKIHTGVLSLSTDNYIPTYSSKNDIHIFNYYNYYNNIYINGKLIHDSKKIV
jgi:hypothetical protein